MIPTRNLSLLLMVILMITPAMVCSQVPIDVMPVRIFQVLDPGGVRLGIIIGAGSGNRGFEAGNEYWRFNEQALLEIAAQGSLEFAVLAEGEWHDPWVVEALGWHPDDASVEWIHPAEVEWTSQEDSLPPVTGGTYFGNATLGGLTIQYSTRGASSLTWFKLTEGAFMQLEDGAVFERDHDIPTTGSWWHGQIER